MTWLPRIKKLLVDKYALKVADSNIIDVSYVRVMASYNFQFKFFWGVGLYIYRLALYCACCLTPCVSYTTDQTW